MNIIKKVVILCMLMGLNVMAQELESYPFESGEIEYDIVLSTTIDGKTTRLEGHEFFYFKEYANVSIMEQTYDKSLKHILLKKIGLVQYRVDFQDKSIQKERVDTNEFSKAKKIGFDTVLGLNCELYKSKNIERCLYKGQILLKEERISSGIKETVIATDIHFNHPIDEAKFSLPLYPVSFQNEIR